MQNHTQTMQKCINNMQHRTTAMQPCSNIMRKLCQTHIQTQCKQRAERHSKSYNNHETCTKQCKIVHKYKNNAKSVQQPCTVVYKRMQHRTQSYKQNLK